MNFLPVIILFRQAVYKRLCPIFCEHLFLIDYRIQKQLSATKVTNWPKTLEAQACWASNVLPFYFISSW